jgi:hypothetical protein
MSSANDYINALGSPDVIVWRGTVAEDRNTVVGHFEGSYQTDAAYSCAAAERR